MLLINVNAAVFKICKVPVCVNLAALTNVVVPVMVVVPETFRFDDSVCVPVRVTFVHVIPPVFSVEAAVHAKVPTLLSTVPAVYVKVPVL